MATFTSVSKPGSLNANEQVSICSRDQDTIIGYADRIVMRTFILPHRASFILIHNFKMQFYIQKRSSCKDYCPSLLDPFSGGVVGKDESYAQNAKRELEEEMGMGKIALRTLGPFAFQNTETFVYGEIFIGEFNGECIIQKEEVEVVYLMTQQEILQNENLFTPDGYAAFRQYVGIVGE